MKTAADEARLPAKEGGWEEKLSFGKVLATRVGEGNESGPALWTGAGDVNWGRTDWPWYEWTKLVTWFFL